MFENLAGKKLLIVGADANSVYIVEQAKKMGIYTVVADWYTDYSKCPAKVIADEAWDVNYRDVDDMVARCKAAGIDGLMAGYSESRVLYCAEISQRIGTPFYCTPEQVAVTRNKRRFKGLCQQYQVPVPKEYCANGNMTAEERDQVQYPVIVKPSDYGGRIGINVCNNREQLDAAIDEAMSYSESKTVVVEEFVVGTELAAIYTISHGRISLSLLNEKHTSHEGLLYKTLCEVALAPSKYYDMYIQTADRQIRSLLEGIGVKDGMAFFQLIANDEKITAFEMGLRLNGGNDWKILDAVNGINYMNMLISHSLTGDMGDDLDKDNPCFDDYLATFVMYCHGGEVGRVEYEKILSYPGVLDVIPYAKVGKQIPDKGTTQQKAFSIKIKAPSREALKDTIRSIQQNVVVENVEGKNMLFKPFDSERL